MMATADPRDRGRDDKQLAELDAVGLHIEVDTRVRGLLESVPLLDELTDSHQRGLGFLSFEGRQALDKLTRYERRLAAENAQKGHPAPSGPSPTPGNLSSIVVEAELTAVLQHSARRLLATLSATQQTTAVRPLKRAATVRHRLLHVRELAHLSTDPSVLAGVVRDLEAITERVEVVIDGNSKVLLEDPCPHCRRRSLLVHFRDDYIQCSPDEKTGERPPCVCPDPLCQCKRSPKAFRHTWYRHPFDERRKSPSDTWHKLRGLIAFNRRNTQPTTKEEPPS